MDDKLNYQQVKTLFDNLDLSGLRTKTKFLKGAPFIEIIKEVQHGKHDLLIKTAEASDSMLKSIFGATDMHLMRKCPCPVWIIKKSNQVKFSHIIAAIDPDPEFPENKELNKEILEHAISLARQENSRLYIVHAWTFVGEDKFRSVRSTMTKAEVDELAHMIKEDHQHWLNETIKQHDLSGIDYKIQLLKGVPGWVISRVAAKTQADLIVMGTVARTGIEGFFIGNTAEKILRTVDCSVLAIKPKGFKSPVKP